MYHFRFRAGHIGEFHDDEPYRVTTACGVTPLKFITYDGMPLVPPCMRDEFNADWREGVVMLGTNAWYR